MHPYIYEQLAKLKMAEDLTYAARQRRLREAVTDRPRSIDFSSIGQRLRVRLFGGSALGGKPADAGA